MYSFHNCTGNGDCLLLDERNPSYQRVQQRHNLTHAAFGQPPFSPVSELETSCWRWDSHHCCWCFLRTLRLWLLQYIWHIIPFFSSDATTAAAVVQPLTLAVIKVNSISLLFYFYFIFISFSIHLIFNSF